MRYSAVPSTVTVSPPQSVAPACPGQAEQVSERLIAGAAGYPYDHHLARLIAAWWQGQSVLPRAMGLGPDDFAHLIQRHFPGWEASGPVPEPPALDPLLADEQGDVADLIQRYRAGIDRSEFWLAQIVAAGCLGRDHLWQDLGLPARSALSQLLADAFPTLVAHNERDMKWKKFLYKQLCEETGIYTCRAPSCDACSDFAECFGPEE